MRFAEVFDGETISRISKRLAFKSLPHTPDQMKLIRRPPPPLTYLALSVIIIENAEGDGG